MNLKSDYSWEDYRLILNAMKKAANHHNMMVMISLQKSNSCDLCNGTGIRNFDFYSRICECQLRAG
jgi:hypothetical protein